MRYLLEGICESLVRIDARLEKFEERLPILKAFPPGLLDESSDDDDSVYWPCKDCDQPCLKPYPRCTECGDYMYAWENGLIDKSTGKYKEKSEDEK